MSQRWKRPQSRIALLVFMVAFLIYLGVSPSASAAAPQDRIREILDAVSAVLDNPQLRGPDKEAERKQQVRRIIHETFEFGGYGPGSVRGPVGQADAPAEGGVRQPVSRLLRAVIQPPRAEVPAWEEDQLRQGLHREGARRCSDDPRRPEDGGEAPSRLPTH